MATIKSEAEVSEDFLKDYLERGGTITDPDTGEELDADDIDEALKEVGGGDSAQPDSRKEKHERAKEAAPDAKAEAREQKKQEQEAREQAELAAKQRAARQKTLKGVATSTAMAITDGGQAAAERISTLSTAGGIGLLLVILTLLVFAVVQVNSKGDTRLKLLWAMLNGETQLEGRRNPKTESESLARGPDAGPQRISTSTSTSGGMFIPLDTFSYRGTAF